MAKPLEVVFLNRPSPDRIFRAWAEIEAAQRGMRLASLDIRKGGEDGRDGENRRDDRHDTAVA